MAKAPTTAVITGFALAMGLNVLGCKGIGEDLPSEEAAKAAILDKIKEEAADSRSYGGVLAINLVSVRKTDGQSREVAGAKGYLMECECQFAFTRDCYWFRAGRNYGNSFFTFKSASSGARLMKSGDREKVSCKVTFEKTEKGWKAKNVRDSLQEDI